MDYFYHSLAHPYKPNSLSPRAARLGTVGAMHTYDVLYSISDLHLGGALSKEDPPAGGPIPLQACGAGARLAAFVRHITARAGEGRSLGLVINGDFIDFLAENPTRYLDFNAPARHVERVAKDPSFRDFFEALSELVAQPSARLVIVIGNHDVELLHPDARDELVRQLRDPPSSRLVFALDGTGYRCVVGGRTVYCTHGNEHDAWNLLDHRALRRLLRRATGGTSVRFEEAAAVTNAGTRLVIDLMNELKVEHPFVDLLKPEVEAMLPILALLERDDAAFQQRVGRTAALLGRLLSDAVRVRQGLLGGEESGATEASDAWLAAPAPPPLAWEAIEDAYRREVSPPALVEGEGTLGVFTAIAGITRGMTRAGGLREHLRALSITDEAFHPNAPDDATFRALDREVDPGTDFILAGHTHLARRMKRRNGEGWYFNSGTWMRLLRLGRPLLEAPEAWAEAEKVLTGSDVDRIVSWRWEGAPAEVHERDRRLLLDRCSVVRIEHDPQPRGAPAPRGVVRGELLVVKDGDGAPSREERHGLSPVELPAMEGRR